MESIGIVAFAGLFTMLAAVHWYRNAPRRIRRHLGAAKRYRIGELPEDTVGRIVGRVEPTGPMLRAPLTGRACVFYQVKVSGDTGTIITEREGVAFRIVDETGAAIVDPRAAEVAVVFDHEARTDIFTAPTAEQSALLARHGERSERWSGIRSLAFSEGVLEPGEDVAILGAGVREPDLHARPESGYREELPTRLRLTSSPRYPLRISDHRTTTR
jgi:hypothetical protein